MALCVASTRVYSVYSAFCMMGLSFINEELSINEAVTLEVTLMSLQAERRALINIISDSAVSMAMQIL